MENLRVLTADRIRAFHKEDVSTPKNCCLVLVGEVEREPSTPDLRRLEDGILGDIQHRCPIQELWRVVTSG